MSAAKNVRSEATEQRNKIIAGAGFGILMVGILYWNFWRDTGPAPVAVAPVTVAAPVIPAPPSAGNAAGVPARTVGNTAAALDPTLHPQAMLVTEAVTYTGTGRNIFAAGGAQAAEVAVIPKPMGPVRTQGPMPPQVYHPPVPPGPPPIELKFFGMATSANGKRQAFLLHGDDVFLASDGDIVQRKYRVVSIGPNSIVVEDLSNNNRQTLPLQATP